MKVRTFISPIMRVRTFIMGKMKVRTLIMVKMKVHTFIMGKMRVRNNFFNVYIEIILNLTKFLASNIHYLGCGHIQLDTQFKIHKLIMQNPNY